MVPPGVCCGLKVAEQRREELLAANKHILDQDYYTCSAASSTVAGSMPAVTASGSEGAAALSLDGRSSTDQSTDGGAAPSGNAAGSPAGASSSPTQQLQTMLSLLARVKSCPEPKNCKAADLLLPELGVTTTQAKLMQAEVYKRMIWELKSQ